MVQKDKKFFIPYIIEGVPAYKTLCITSKDVKSFHLNGKEISIIFVPTDDPKVYKDVVHFQWQELANRANETRCKVPDGQGGYITCRENCRNCPNLRSGRPDSLDFEEEVNGYEVMDLSQDKFEIIELQMVLEGLFAKLRKINPSYADLLENMYHGQSQEEISIFSSKSTGTVGEKTLLALALARKILEEEN